jgi:hypothetical protein
MKCPVCQAPSRVYETRQSISGTIRRRECLVTTCLTRFASREVFDGLVGERKPGPPQAVSKQTKPEEKKTGIKQMPQSKERRVEQGKLVKDDLDVFFRESFDPSDLGIDIGRGGDYD